MFQETNIVILSKDFSKSKTEIVFDVRVEFQSGNTTFIHVIKDSKAYTSETNDTSGELKSYCSNVPEMPHLDKIVDTILNGQVVDEDSEFFDNLQCPQDSHRLIHTVWEGLDYFYCFDTTGKNLGSFLGPAMVGKVEYLSKQEASSITIQAPHDLECDAIDLSQLSQNPIEALTLQESRRRLREMAGASCAEQVRLGKCEFCYTDKVEFPKGANMYNLISTAFSSLQLNLYSFPDIPRRKKFKTKKINIRRLNSEKMYRFEHDGLPCIFVHVAGVETDKNELVDEFDEYWGESTRLNMPPYCSSVKFVKMNTLTTLYAGLRVGRLLKGFRREKGKIIREMIIISHGSGGAYINRALVNGWIKFDRTVRWLGLNVPHSGSHLVTRRETKCTRPFSNLIVETAGKSGSKLNMRCHFIRRKMGWKFWYRDISSEGHRLELSAGLCGTVASHIPNDQLAYLKYLETEETKGVAEKTLTDGVNRLDNCLRFKSAKKIDPRFTVLATNYWDGQMRRADRLQANGGVRHWLHVTAAKALETLVNGNDPDLMHTRANELEKLYNEAEEKNKGLQQFDTRR